MYKLMKPAFPNTPIVSVQRQSDYAFIPFDPENTDYKAYLAWLAEGNTPIPADE
jgi:hypothetical protein